MTEEVINAIKNMDGYNKTKEEYEKNIHEFGTSLKGLEPNDRNKLLNDTLKQLKEIEFEYNQKQQCTNEIKELTRELNDSSNDITKQEKKLAQIEQTYTNSIEKNEELKDQIATLKNRMCMCRLKELNNKSYHTIEKKEQELENIEEEYKDSI